MNDIEVLNQMGKNNKEIYLFPLENISKLDIRPVRSTMEMLIDSGVARKMQDGEMVGAFIVADREQFYKIKNGRQNNYVSAPLLFMHLFLHFWACKSMSVLT